jgi:hypothetical protein
MNDGMWQVATAIGDKKLYVKNPESPALCTGINGSRGFGGMCPQFNLAFSLEEAPTNCRGSSLC